MFRSTTVTLAAVTFAAILVVTGCGGPSKATLTPAVGQKVVYEFTSTMIKDYKFDQPTLNKSKEDQTSTVIAVQFEQVVADVDANGTATADITIKAVQCKMINKNELRYEFDSTNEKFKSDGLNAVIGKSYRVALSPDGKAAVVDAAAARAVTVSGEGQKMAQKLFSDESIIERHQLPLPAKDNVLSAKKSWSVIQPSPPGLLAPKSYEKVYAVSSLSNERAEVTMTAKESMGGGAGAAPAGSASSMGIFAKMFDNQDDYTGKLILNLVNGTVETYEEKLVSSYVAQEKPQGSAPDAAPDTLLMRLTYGIGLKKVN